MVNLDDYVKDVFAFVFENLCLCVVLSMFFFLICTFIF